ncbi:hypothetical protein PLEOSDRAFT_1102787 [Pleurotus ostreatus PC15]|uniref:Uncharacterized protein n=1 Tax=Pleurotus ostreatus (strain PC15) TaxID=1137138 RepID=A0A067NX96_PLEO1|nr:hypothetical protein PLEOSDRAFT_1102787 [Pleurotus ostreatus PC15]
MGRNKHLSTRRMAKPDPLTINHLVILTCLNDDKVEVEKLARVKSTGCQKGGPLPDFLGEIEVGPIREFDNAERRGARQGLKTNPAVRAMYNILANEVNKAVSKSLGYIPPSAVCQRAHFASLFTKTHIREEATLTSTLVISEPVCLCTEDGCKKILKRKRRRITAKTGSIIPLLPL